MGRPIAWSKSQPADFVYFNHSQHVLSGVGMPAVPRLVERMDRIEQSAP